MTTSLLIRAYGRVQGVGYRFSVLRAAQENNITGWVRNETDGTVCISATGTRDDLSVFIERIHVRADSHIRVNNLDIMEIQPILSADFRIRY
ncbi:MAG: acylphosphatase [Methanospirillaceae archaeon]|nr:acylphosphatase [Methanospirillaceae archaeon]